MALGIGEEVSWMRETTLENYKQADRQTRIEQRAAATKRAA